MPIKSKTKIHKDRSMLSNILFVILLLYVISMVLPLVWGFVTSFKGKWDFRLNKFGLPKEWLFSNYSLAFNTFFVTIRTAAGFEDIYLGNMFLYSVLYAFGCAFAAAFVACTTAYMTARFPCKFSSLLYNIVIVCMILPIIGALPSQMQLSKALGLYNHIYGLWIMRGHFLGMYFLIFHATFKGFAATYAESAEIDGASNLQIYLRVVLPLVSNMFFTIFLIEVIAFWNDYQTPLIFMPNYPTVAYGLFQYNFSSVGELSSVPMKLTGAMIMLIPILIVFFIFQKRLMNSNLSISGIKE